MIKKLKNYGVNMEIIEDKDSDDRFADMTFVVTGTLPTLSRKQAGELIENMVVKFQVQYLKRQII